MKKTHKKIIEKVERRQLHKKTAMELLRRVNKQILKETEKLKKNLEKQKIILKKLKNSV